MTEIRYWYSEDGIDNWETYQSRLNGSENAVLDVKRVFVSFVQQFFANHSKYIWNSDIRQTRLIVADKNAIELGVVERRPGIIISRGGMQWVFSAGQRTGRGNLDKGFLYEDGLETLKGPITDISSNKNAYTDLLRGTITFNCISKNGLQAEEIANELFMALTAFKSEIYKHGIHMIHGMSLGEEQIVRSNAGIELITVPVSLSFTSQRDIQSGASSRNITVSLEENNVYENIHYMVDPTPSGYDLLVFKTAPESGSELIVNYLNAINLENVEDDLSSQVDGTTTTFTLSDNVYGYYKVLNDINISMEQSSDTNEYYTASGFYNEDGEWELY